MELVIRLSDKEYSELRSASYYSFDKYTAYLAMKNGIPLPEHHGRLIDAEKIANDINALKDNWNRYGNEYESGRYESYDYAIDTIEDAPTIIEGSESK